MKKKGLIISLFLGLSLALSLPIIHQISNAGYAYSYSSRIEKYRLQAIDSLVEVDLSLYRDTQKEELTSLRNETINKINSSEDYNEIDAIVSSFNRYILTIKTDEQFTIEEAEAAQEETDVYYISSLDDLLEFRDDVNDGYSYKGDTVILTENIVIPSGFAFGNPIGYTDAKPFSGTFDGNGHSISGFTISGDNAMGLFSRLTNGTVKNLNMIDVTVTTQTQRSSGLVARMQGATIENCHILSGTLNGLKENGGLVGVAVGEGNVISNCSNKANISAPSVPSTTYGGNGGIVGLVFSGSLTVDSCRNEGNITGKKEGNAGIVGFSAATPTAITITNCSNAGTISGAAHGTGGIFGAHTDNSSMVLTISGCENYGSITGANHVGGVAGLPRASSTDSKIINCKNYGNVSGTGTYVGGIVSRARIAVIDCGCLSTVTLTCGATVKLASECLNTGLGSSANPGFICTVLDTSGNYHGSVTGGYLFD